MDTNRLKKFAVDARNKIKAGVEAKLSTLGFDGQGNVPDSMKPQLMQGGSLWNGQLMTESFYHQWMALYDAVKKHGVHHIYEEAAYTWFNRLVAIRILQKNGIIEPVLTYVDEARTPKIVDDARSAGRIPPMPEADRQRLMDLLDDDTKVTEQFAILISAYCHANPIIRQSFGRMADYTELLLPNNILAENGFIDDINHTEFITDEDYKSSELIGWLYQFYISERKDEVFAKKGKYDADEIAPATQIFTPHWIVEYMVQNTIGRIYLDWHPEATDDFAPKWKYLVPQSEPRDISLPSPLERGGGEAELTDLRFADLGCGSGHILGYMFDILFDLYIYEGYTRKEAVENILSHNITGVDLDLRAKQLATFALLLKACQKDESFRDGNVLPHVLTMPELIAERNRHQLFHEFFKGEETNNILAELDDAFDLLKDAQTLGSIMKFNLSKSTLLAIRQTMDYWRGQSFVPESVTTLLPSFRIILALTEKYTALVMNPPYMGSGRFDNVLSKYVKDNYPTGKADLFAVFMLVAKNRLVPNGKYAMINMQSWMFLSSFEQLRKDLIETMHIDSMLHLGPRTFDELSGEVVQNTAFVVSNINDADKSECSGTFYRLVDGKNCADKERMFLENRDGNVDGAKVYYPNVNQKDFEKIPGYPIGYWVSERLLESFSNSDLTKICEIRCGLATGRNDIFLRLWYEVNFNKIGFGYSRKEAQQSGEKWFPYDKAGEFRKWYGNHEYILDWQDDGKVLQNTMHPDGTRIWAHNFNLDKIFQPHIGWSDIISGGLSFRYYEKGFNFDGSANAAFVESNEKLPLILGYSNSKVVSYIRPLLNPTIHFKPGNFLNLPFKDIEFNSKSVIDNITLSKLDWDAHETSWDFAENPLVAIMKQAEGEEPVVSKVETGSFKPRNQQSLSEKPTVSKRETDSFAAENDCEQCSLTI
uniref:BREX-1 system adenine-specific DNA-methyltransferase PglX n=1 Tax=Prevotella sp. TaxID=59823 RepID=UPI0040287FEA